MNKVELSVSGNAPYFWRNKNRIFSALVNNHRTTNSVVYLGEKKCRVTIFFFLVIVPGIWISTLTLQWHWKSKLEHVSQITFECFIGENSIEMTRWWNYSFFAIPMALLPLLKIKIFYRQWRLWNLSPSPFFLFTEIIREIRRLARKIAEKFLYQNTFYNFSWAISYVHNVGNMNCKLSVQIISTSAFQVCG